MTTFRPSHRRPHRADDRGQAALVMVLGIVMLLVTGGTLLASNSVQHDPLVQSDVVTHAAYRALQSGLDSYLNTINADPSLVNCNTTSATSTCKTGITYDTWTPVPESTSSAGIPEYYLWTNPQLCFSATKSYDTTCTLTTATHNFEYVQELVVGAAGTPGHFVYQSSVANFAPANSFLTHLWWSNFESAPKAIPTVATHSVCKYDYKNGYRGPGTTCNPIYFLSGTHVDGPIFTNDSIYAIGSPTFGTSTTLSPVTTGDPSCYFVARPGTHGSKPSTCATVANGVNFTRTNSHLGVTSQTPPTTDTQLEQVAKRGGCTYSGPTTISFYSTPTSHAGYMNVTSPETPRTGSHDGDNSATNTNQCLGTGVPVPTATKGNGVIFVATATSSCAGNGDNPFDGLRTGQTPAKAQIVEGGRHPFNYTEDAVSTTLVDCEGDAFVRNTDAKTTPSGAVPGVGGQLTVAAGNNIVITGTLTYSDCGTGWDSKTQCAYHAGSVNDSLGLIANQFVEVNRPVTAASGCGGRLSRCPSKDNPSTSFYYGDIGWGWKTLSRCTTTVTDLQAVLCNPSRAGKGLTIDAAILNLSREFTVNNFSARLPTGTNGSCRSAETCTLTIYGVIDQYWRGPIGLSTGEGYVKYYTWDSRLQYVSVPHYLTPGTPSWALVSSSTILSNACSRWPKPYPTGAPYLTTRTSTASSMQGDGPKTTTC